MLDMKKGVMSEEKKKIWRSISRKVIITDNNDIYQITMMAFSK